MTSDDDDGVTGLLTGTATTAAATAAIDPELAFLSGIFGALSVLLVKGVRARQQRRARLFVEGYVTNAYASEKEAAAALDAKVSDPEVQDVVYEQVRHAMLALDDELVAPLGRLLRIWTTEDHLDKRHVRDLGEVLVRMRAEDLLQLQSALVAAFQVVDADDLVTLIIEAEDVFDQTYPDAQQGISVSDEGRETLGGLERAIVIRDSRSSRRIISLLREYQLASNEFSDTHGQLLTATARLIFRVVGAP